MEHLYEQNLKKYYSLLDTQISKIYIYSKDHLISLMIELESLFEKIKKETKKYTIFLTLQDKNKFKNELKIKEIEKKLTTYKNKIIQIKVKFEINDLTIIPHYKLDLLNDNIKYDTYNKMNEAIRKTNDIENISSKIVINLENQSIEMKNSINKVNNMNEKLTESKNHLNEIINKEDKDKKIIFFTALILLSILLFFFCYKIWHKLRK